MLDMNMSLQSLRRWWTGGQDHEIRFQTKCAPRPESPWLAQLDAAHVPRSLNYPSCSLGRILDQTADRFPELPALIYRDNRWTYRQLADQANRLATALARHGVRRGDRVLLTLPNCPEFAICFFAIAKLGAVAVNAGPLMGKDDLATVIAITSARVGIGLDLQTQGLTSVAHHSSIELFVWVSLQSYQGAFRRLGYQFKLWHNRGGNGSAAEHLPLEEILAHTPPRPPRSLSDAHQVALLQPTGGTTGGVKLAELSHANLISNALQVSVWMGCQPGQERILAVLPMFHAYGLTLCLIAPVFNAGAI